ncbi:MAG: hypothetical protein ABIY51_11000 [Ferruginibacter sp.]
MKQTILKSYKSFTVFLTGLLVSMLSIAQDKKVDVNINTKSGNDNVLMQPWVWIVGGAVFLIIIVALLRNNSNK